MGKQGTSPGVPAGEFLTREQMGAHSSKELKVAHLMLRSGDWNQA